MIRTAPSKIVMFSAEAAPFAKDGGLGDVVGALPKELKKLGFDPVVVIPAYASVLQQGRFDIQRCKEVEDFTVRIGNRMDRAEIYRTQFDRSGVDVYMIGSRKYFGRQGIYNNPNTGEGYPDNDRRFIFFMKAGIELLPRLKHPVDILHFHDSQTALIPSILQLNYGDNPFYRDVGTLFTIHNLAYQGIYSPKALLYAGIDSKHFYPLSPLEYWNKVNFMKAGILLADKVNTVSQTYALEIQRDHEYGHGLEGVLQSRKADVTGIVNGIDGEEWNPETDCLIPSNYSGDNLNGKAVCKLYLQRRFNLSSQDDRVPLIGMVSRLVEQKGIDLITESIPEIIATKMQLVVLGVGQKKYHTILKDIAARYPENVAVHLAFDNELAHQIEAGSDMFLMPSRYEPCGLSQLISLRYGTIPVVRATGGLADTIKPYRKGRGTGFTFSGYSADEMMEALKQARRLYSNANRWKNLMVRAMSEDWSWEKSAEGYIDLYRSIYSRRHPKVQRKHP
ncbi:MAG: glycogen synthase GlgA [Acidobacteriota bacterium]|jgi:starch synthase